MTNAKVHQGFCNDKKIEEHGSRFQSFINKATDGFALKYDFLCCIIFLI